MACQIMGRELANSTVEGNAQRSTKFRLNMVFPFSVVSGARYHSFCVKWFFHYKAAFVYVSG